MALTMRDRVDLGAMLLDKQRPGWEEEIVLGALDLGSCEACILGQLYTRGFRLRDVSPYHRGLAKLSLSDDSAYLFGFCADSEQPESLTGRWRAVIRARLQARGIA